MRVNMKGKVKVEVEGRVEEGYNEISMLGNAYFKAEAMRPYTEMRGVEGGHDFIETTMYTRGNNNNIVNNPSSNITVYLMNLSKEDIERLKQKSKMPVKMEGKEISIDKSKVVGWANTSVAGSEEKEGVYALRDEKDVMGIDRGSIAWTWEKGKIKGEFNVVAIGIDKMSKRSKGSNGISVYKGLESVDYINTGKECSGKMLGPTWVGDGRSILYGDDEGVARYKRDIETGVVEELQEEDKLYKIPLLPIDIIEWETETEIRYIYNTYGYVVDKETMKQVGDMKYIESGFKTEGSFFEYDGKIYTEDGEKFIAFNKEDFSRDSSKDIDPQKEWNIDLIKIAGSTSSPIRNYLRVRGYGKDRVEITRRDGTSEAWVYNIREGKIEDTVEGKLGRVVESSNGVKRVYKVLVEDYKYKEQGLRKLSGQGNNYSSFGQDGVKESIEMGDILSFKVYEEPFRVSGENQIYIHYTYVYDGE